MDDTSASGSPSILGPGGLPGHGPSRRHLAGHLGQHEPQPLLLGERGPERAALREVPRRRLQPGAGDPDARGRDRDPALAERRERDPIAVAFRAEPVRDGHLGAVEHELGRRAGPDPHLPLVRPEPEPGRPLLDEEGRDRLRPRLGSSVAKTR